MAENFPGPYQLRIFYDVQLTTGGELTHVMNVNLPVVVDPDPGTIFASIDIPKRVGTPNTLLQVMNGLVAVMQPLLSLSDTAITYAEFWKYTPGTYKSQYISTQDISLAGTNVGDARYAGVMIWTFRTIEGGSMKIYLMEAANVENVTHSYANLSAAEKAFADWFTDDATSYALAKDTSHPWVFLRMLPGTHEATFKQRFRK